MFLGLCDWWAVCSPMFSIGVFILNLNNTHMDDVPALLVALNFIGIRGLNTNLRNTNIFICKYFPSASRLCITLLVYYVTSQMKCIKVCVVTHPDKEQFKGYVYFFKELYVFVWPKLCVSIHYESICGHLAIKNVVSHYTVYMFLEKTE